MKDELTHRQLLPVIDFLQASVIWLKEQSQKRDAGPNRVTFSHSHTFTTRDWTEGHAWRISTTKQIRFIPHLNVYVAVAPGVQGDLTDQRAEAYQTLFEDGSWDSFDDYTRTSSNVFILKRDLNRPEHYNCTCHKNSKEFTCAHSLGLALMREILVPPEAAHVQLLGRKRRRGRRPQLPPAWEMLPFALNSPVHHPQQENAILLGLDVGMNLAEELVQEAGMNLAAELVPE